LLLGEKHPVAGARHIGRIHINMEMGVVSLKDPSQSEAIEIVCPTVENIERTEGVEKLCEIKRRRLIAIINVSDVSGCVLISTSNPVVCVR